jgi:hypothetical protein
MSFLKEKPNPIFLPQENKVVQSHEQWKLLITEPQSNGLFLSGPEWFIWEKRMKNGESSGTNELSTKCTPPRAFTCDNCSSLSVAVSLTLTHWNGNKLIFIAASVREAMDVSAILAVHDKQHCVITGKQSQDERNKSVRSFINENVDIVVISAIIAKRIELFHIALHIYLTLPEHAHDICMNSGDVLIFLRDSSQKQTFQEFMIPFYEILTE